MRQIVIAVSIFLPAESDLAAHLGELANTRLASRIALREAVAAGFQLGCLRLQSVDMPTRVGLSPVKATTVQEQRGSNLIAIQIQDGSRNQRSDAPIPSKHVLHLLPVKR